MSIFYITYKNMFIIMCIVDLFLLLLSNSEKKKSLGKWVTSGEF